MLLSGTFKLRRSEACRGQPFGKGWCRRTNYGFREQLIQNLCLTLRRLPIAVFTATERSTKIHEIALTEFRVRSCHFADRCFFSKKQELAKSGLQITPIVTRSCKTISSWQLTSFSAHESGHADGFGVTSPCFDFLLTDPGPNSQKAVEG